MRKVPSYLKHFSDVIFVRCYVFSCNDVLITDSQSGNFVNSIIRCWPIVCGRKTMGQFSVHLFTSYKKTWLFYNTSMQETHWKDISGYMYACALVNFGFAGEFVRVSISYYFDRI